MILKLLGAATSDTGCTIYAMPGVVEFIEGLSDEVDIEATDALFERVMTNGLPTNRDKCRALGDGVFELKPHRIRLPFFHHPKQRRTVVLTHGFPKKSQKTPNRHINHAKRQKGLFLTALEEGNIQYDDMA